LLYIDMAYSLDELRVRGHFQFFEARHSGSYFDKVIGLHPLADRVARLGSPIERKNFSDRQDVIEAASASLGLPKWLLPLDVLISQRRLLDHVAKVIREEKVELIAATDPLYSGLFGLWLKRRTGVPLVLHLVANFDLNFEATGSLAMPRMFPLRAIEKFVIRYVLKHADLVAAGSETLRDYAITHGAPPTRCEVFKVAKNIVQAHRVPPGERDPLTKAERERLGIVGATKMLLTVARLEPVKMVDHSIRAFSIVARDHPDALLLLAGQGSERGRLEALAQELGVGDRVRFLGLINQDILSRLEPHCLTLSPLTGMALFETSMAGSPAIAYNIDSACEEMVETGVTGALIEPKDWKSMGEAASRILSDPAEYRRLSIAIRERAVRLTDEQALYAHEHSVFDRLLSN
jgi:glycosyltransferase involved in cell wall biosynthesis